MIIKDVECIKAPLEVPEAVVTGYIQSTHDSSPSILEVFEDAVKISKVNRDTILIGMNKEEDNVLIH